MMKCFSVLLLSFLLNSPAIAAEQKECIVGGCSGQLCVAAKDGAVMSTCEWRPEYACYEHSACEMQPDGKCGWTPNDALKACLADPKGAAQ